VKKHLAWLLLPVLLLLGIYRAKTLPQGDRPLLATESSWTIEGDIRNSGPRQGTLFTDRLDAIYLIVAPFDSDGSAKAKSAQILCPEWMSLMVFGDLNRPGNDVGFRLEGTDDVYPIHVCSERFLWRRVTCRMPDKWLGKPIRLTVDAGPRNADNTFGVSNPRALESGSIFSAQTKALVELPPVLFTGLVFLVAGFPPAILLVRRDLLPGELLLPATIIFSSLAGYATFWAYFCHARFGYWFASTVLLASTLATGTVLGLDRKARALVVSASFLTPLMLTGLVALFYLSLLYAIDLQSPLLLQPRIRFCDFTLAIDNEMPAYFADRLYRGEDPRELGYGWHSSDRPPLQAGIILLQLPLAFLRGGQQEYAAAVGCAVQCSWVPAMWFLWKSARLARRQAGLALLFTVLTGFALFNTVFAWPKMLSAGLALFAITLALFNRASPGVSFSFPKAALLGLSAGLASLAHAGVTLTLLPFGLLLLMPRWNPGLARLLAAGAVYIALLAPWSLYQTRYDPPGNELLRQHIIGGGPTWKADEPMWRNLIAAYAALRPVQILKNKLANLQVLFTAAPDQYPWPPDATPAAWPWDPVGFRRCDFLCLFWTLGLLNVGWIVLMARAGRKSVVLNPVLAFTIPGLALVSILFWVAVMFGPGATVVHQGSYATVLLLFASLSAYLATLPGRWPYLFLVLHGALFVWGWLLTSPANGFGVPNLFMVPLSVLFFLLLIWFAVGNVARDETTQVTGAET
jgi:hypothetical protein